jgi:hypothetical protein
MQQKSTHTTQKRSYLELGIETHLDFLGFMSTKPVSKAPQKRRGKWLRVLSRIRNRVQALDTKPTS